MSPQPKGKRAPKVVIDAPSVVEQLVNGLFGESKGETVPNVSIIEEKGEELSANELSASSQHQVESSVHESDCENEQEDEFDDNEESLDDDEDDCDESEEDQANNVVFHLYELFSTSQGVNITEALLQVKESLDKTNKILFKMLSALSNKQG